MIIVLDHNSKSKKFIRIDPKFACLYEIKKFLHSTYQSPINTDATFRVTFQTFVYLR